MNTLLNRLARNRHSVVDLLCVISDIEGKLMEIDAFETLRINCSPDDDGFTDNDYQIFEIAHCLGETFGLNFIPENYSHYFNDVILLGKKIGQGFWDKPFQNGVLEGKHSCREFSSCPEECGDFDSYIKWLSRVH
ncbi:hypothetical protein ECA0592 [Pectobacterium atrosepticum SCRI1043]|uniref:Uncharacterized protein n=3 Tax=Pectobacterium TaxID=122277 RepID=Q6D9M2_PECAS|nr:MULTISPECIES: hypothetical protein [Pectobacterium]GKV85753.1 hypothetical protein PEC301296_20650 [Pectobacterium carotovorum subsp. carotovorum]AFH56883.1 hypothetical protein KCQ_13185 [Pectobacterium atrosepticum]AIA69922.1 hypothetical protein EV46_04815 [Pectobacterium atrosepticum]AIK12839.1 hypothetical protein GZ59_09760 [Pectobacterium atrosepticum]ATY89415.1 hypothetical protein CVS35_03050 [Pectobacterium atrosepticum]